MLEHQAHADHWCTNQLDDLSDTAQVFLSHRAVHHARSNVQLCDDADMDHCLLAIQRATTQSEHIVHTNRFVERFLYQLDRTYSQ